MILNFNEILFHESAFKHNVIEQEIFQALFNDDFPPLIKYHRDDGSFVINGVTNGKRLLTLIARIVNHDDLFIFHAWR